MTRNIFHILILITILTSCEGIVSGEGKVISSIDKLPVDSVRITWRTNETYSNKEGEFKIGEFVGCPTGCPDLELVLEKRGFVTKYVNLTKENPKQFPIEGVTIEMNPTSKIQDNIWNSKLGTLFYYISMIVAGLGLITLVYIFILKIEHRGFWFIVIFLGTAALHYNILSGTFDFQILRPVTRFNPPHFQDPAWYKLSLPIGTILFWMHYFKVLRKRKTLQENSK